MDVIETTKKALANIPKPEIIVWAEVSAIVNTSKEANDMLSTLAAMAKVSKTLIGVAYGNLEVGGNLFSTTSNSPPQSRNIIFFFFW